MSIYCSVHICVEVADTFELSRLSFIILGICHVQRLNFMDIDSLQIAPIPRITQHHFCSAYISLSVIPHEDAAELRIQCKIFAEVLELLHG